MKNRISEVITDADLAEVNNAIETIDKKLPFLINLSVSEKKGGFKMGNANLSFVEKSKQYLQSNPEFMPSFTSNEETQKAIILYDHLITIFRNLNILADKISDTASIAGMEALSGVLSYYNSVKQASKENASNAATIYNELQSRFPGRGKKKQSDIKIE